MSVSRPTWLRGSRLEPPTPTTPDDVDPGGNLHRQRIRHHERGDPDTTATTRSGPLPTRQTMRPHAVQGVTVPPDAEPCPQPAIRTCPNCRPTHYAHPMFGGSGRSGADTRSDEDLLVAHTVGDPDAFSTLINRHYTYLWNVALRATGNPEDASDVLQEALLSAHRTAHTFRADAKVRSWFHRITVNKSVDRLRRNAARRTVPLMDYEPVIADHHDEYARSDLGTAIGDALDALPEQQRAAVIAVDVQGYSIAEAAHLLGVPEGTVKSRTSRARVRLAKSLGYLQVDDD